MISQKLSEKYPQAMNECNSFRGILRNRDSNSKNKYYSILEEMQDEALMTWQSQLGEDKWGSYTGFPHARNIEKHLDNAVPDKLKNEFSSIEIFVLLASVLFHDIGKLYVNEGERHQELSCIKIQEIWPYLKIPDKEIADWISIIACSHGWDNPWPPKKCECNKKCKVYCTASKNGKTEREGSKLSTVPRRNGVPVRLERIAALLRLCDEVDSQTSRTIQDYIKEGLNKDSTLNWRRFIADVHFDLRGECIKLRASSFDSEWSEEDLGFLIKALKNIKNVLDQWKDPLLTMELFYSESFIEVMAPAPALMNSENVPTKKNSKGGYEIKWCQEPALKKRPIFKSLIKAMLRLDRSVIGFGVEQLFSWDALAEETGINDIPLIRLAAERICAGYKCRCSKDAYKMEKNDESSNLEFPNVICSHNGWCISNEKIKKPKESKNEESNLKKENKEYEVIPTGIKALDGLLFPEHDKGGIYFPVNQGKKIAPITTVQGYLGQGKTTICLQIAMNLVTPNDDNTTQWTVFYYALEQKPVDITQHLEGYRYFIESNSKSEYTKDERMKCLINMEDNAWYECEKEKIKGKILLPRFTLYPLTNQDTSNDEIFERRYIELESSIQWAKAQQLKAIYIFDSLSAFLKVPLSRGQVQRIFSLFRSNDIPLILTLETHLNWVLKQEELSFEYIRYLSDVVISMAFEEKENYFRQTIEVQKTRYNRRILGKHLVKLKSPKQKATKEFDDRLGVVVYPSIDNHIVESRDDKSEPSDKSEIKDIKLYIDHNALPIGNKEEENENFFQNVSANSCIVISGPMGGHKFAVGVNLLLAAADEEKEEAQGASSLIVSLAEEKEIKLKGVALLNGLEKRRESLEINSSNSADHKDKKIFEQKGKHISILNYRLGKIMSEEFLYLFESYIDREKGVLKRVLFSDTAQLRTRYPLLYGDTLFLPALIDILKSRGLMSVFIDVEENQTRTQSLLAAADCRIFVERDKMHGEQNSWRNIIRVDNVRGKCYDRQPRMLSVVDNILKITRIEKRQEIRTLINQKMKIRVKNRITINCECIDVSKQGLRVKHSDVLLLSAADKMEVVEGEKQIAVINGDIIWTRLNNDGYTTGIKTKNNRIEEVLRKLSVRKSETKKVKNKRRIKT